jgi:hypothetical protein
MSARALPRLLLLLLLTLPIGACAVVGGIFKAGFVTAIVAIVLIIAVIGFFMRGRGG